MAKGAGFSPPVSLLVVDDEHSLRHILRTGLKRYGCQVHLACDGREALDLLANGLHVHLVLTDIVMPRVNGLELHRILSATSPEVPVLLMTGCVDQPPEGWNTDVIVLRKPFRLPDLCFAIKRILPADLAAQVVLPSSTRRS